MEGRRMKKMVSYLYIQFRNYYKAHMWCSFVTVIGISVLLVVITMQIILKQEYIKYLKEKTYDTENTILVSVNKNINFLVKEIIQIGSEVSVDEDLYNLVEDYERADGNKVLLKRTMNNVLSQYAQYSQWIVDVCIISEDGLIYQYDRYSATNDKFLWRADNEFVLRDLHKQVGTLLSEGEIPRYAYSTFPIIHPGKENLNLFHVAFPLKGNQFFDNVTRSVVVTFNTAVLGEFLDAVHQKNEDIATGYITDQDDIIVFHKDTQYIGEIKTDYLKEKKLENISVPVDRLGWTLNISIDEDKMLHQVDVIYYKGIIFYSLILFLLFVFLISIVKWVLKPVSEITKSIKNVKQGNLTNEILIEGHHEIWQLAGEYNKMIAALRDMNEQVEKYNQDKLLSMKKQQRAERDALESQINAHFICNTLGVINYEAMESGNHKVSIQIKKLSNILRYTFDQKHQNVYMFQELAWIEQYLFLQKSRLEEVFDYVLDFPQELGTWPCRKLMLQPFVENSILHGFEGVQKGGIIRIAGERFGEKLKLTIEDNGHGMDGDVESIIQKVIKDPIETKKGEIGIGISNVITRMQMYYGQEFEMLLDTQWGKGTKFIFLLPMPSDVK